MVTQAAEYSGPMPPPHMLVGYEDVPPGCAERILKQYELDNENVRRLQRQALAWNFAERMLARVLGFVFAVVALGIAAWLASNGHAWVAGIIAAATTAGVVAALVKGHGPVVSTSASPGSSLPKPPAKRGR